MMIAILGTNADGWGTNQLENSLQAKKIHFEFFGFSDLSARVGYGFAVRGKQFKTITDFSALITRVIGRGSLEEIVFRMDLLHAVKRRGLTVINPPTAIERCVDKYYALALIEESGIPVPRTIVTESVEDALKGFHELGKDVVLKPIFGSRGVGSTRISDANVAERIFNSIRFHHGVLYVQQFVAHGNSDIRAFVIGDRVVAAMERIGESWKTNVSQGARPVAVKLSGELETLAINAAKAVDCKIAGVDILQSVDGPLVVELNSQPGWRGLQSVTQVNIADLIIEYVLSEAKE
ncbi:MAG: RimK family alpha-L-glutamate ligase [Candidatus Bathyarchaeota archaeon]|nr:RimK family alpha-L-glutamate ligase [Candidatus Bathyarchaeota archaeon]